jgi:hypothetical protein
MTIARRTWRSGILIAVLATLFINHVAAQNATVGQNSTTVQAVTIAASSGDAQAVAVAISVAYVCGDVNAIAVGIATAYTQVGCSRHSTTHSSFQHNAIQVMPNTYHLVMMLPCMQSSNATTAALAGAINLTTPDAIVAAAAAAEGAGGPAADAFYAAMSQALSRPNPGPAQQLVPRKCDDICVYHHIPPYCCTDTAAHDCIMVQNKAGIVAEGIGC